MAADAVARTVSFTLANAQGWMLYAAVLLAAALAWWS